MDEHAFPIIPSGQTTDSQTMTDTTTEDPEQLPQSKDVHLRQRQLQKWSQQHIGEQKVLVLGVGGVGSHAASALARMGVASIDTVDYDVVEAHNLNRQSLYGIGDIDRSKAETCVEELDWHGNNLVEIRGHHFDAVKEWERTVSLIRASTAVVNTIDYGDCFDACVAKACEQLNIPMVLAGTEPRFGHTISVFFQSNEYGKPCYGCCHDLSARMQDWQETLANILDIKTLEGLPKDNQPDEGGSTQYSAGIAGMLCCNQLAVHWNSMRFSMEAPPTQTILYLHTMESVPWHMPIDPSCWMKCDPFEGNEEDMEDTIETQAAAKDAEQQARQPEP